MQRNNQRQRNRLLLIAALAVVTIGAHLLTQRSIAIPTIPTSDGLDFAAPGGSSVAFSGKLDRHAVLAGGDGQVKMELVLAAENRPAKTKRIPTDFVIVLDRSGSMNGEKIEQARAAVRELISQLAVGDRFALVSYSSGAAVSIPLSEATAEARQHWRQVVASIQPGGGTNMSDGLDLALEITQGTGFGRATRWILISDGLANQGDASVEGLSARARRAAGREAVVSTVGVGADFNEFLMSQVADAGTGNYYYLEDVAQLAQVFSDEFSASRETVATAVAVSIAPGDGVRVIDAAGYPLEHVAGKTIFRPGSLFAGQERRIWVTLAVPNEAAGEHSLGDFALHYKDPTQSNRGLTRIVEFTDTPIVASVLDETTYHDSFDRETWARSVAEEDYNALQQRVASHVRQGRRDEAKQEIDDFRTHNARLNQVMQQEAIQEKLEELQRLHTDVDDAFQGQNQLHKQKTLSKTRQYSGWEGRRAGSKKAPSIDKNAGKGGA
ncbi:MAG: VWA domain-containing protein [Acidobacteriota bacterium]